MDLSWMLHTAKQKYLDLQVSLSEFLIKYIIEEKVLTEVIRNRCVVSLMVKSGEGKVLKVKCRPSNGGSREYTVS